MLEASHVLGVVDEILARSPDFFDRNVLTFNEEDLRSALEVGLPASGTSGLEEFGEAIRRAWAASGVQYKRGESSDPVGHELLRSISDSVHPDLTTGVGRPETLDLIALLRSEYTEIIGPSGSTRGFIRKGGSRPLLLINALGLPINIWSRLLFGEHDFKIIVPTLPSCDALRGGMTETNSARELAEILAELVNDLAFPEVDVLGWCNGGRVGVELFRLSLPSIAKLILLSPTFRGGITPSLRTSRWEDSLDMLLSWVVEAPGRAKDVSSLLQFSQPGPDWEQFTNQPMQRAGQLFGMPRRAFTTALVTPMVVTPESLVHYGRRTYLDEALSAEPPEPLPGDRIVLIQGSHDSVVDNVQAKEWLHERAPGFACYEVSGAGHYIQDLQCAYLVHLLRRVVFPGAMVGGLPSRVHEITVASP